MRKNNSLLNTVLMGLSLLPITVVAGTRDDIEALQIGQQAIQNRLDGMEANLQNKGLLEMMQMLTHLQDELRELRGQIEQQTFELEGLRKRQRELYLDIDRRLSDIQLDGSTNITQTETADAAKPATEITDKPDKPESLPAAVKISEADLDQERLEYKAAFKLLKDAQYGRAIKEFAAFQKKYPNGRYADNAQYWLGEANYVSRNFNKALQEFNKVVKNYPRSSKVPDAKLKIGYTYYELEQWDEARKVLLNITTTHGNSSVAPLADQRLQRMSQEGR